MSITISNLEYKVKIKSEVIKLLTFFRQLNISDYEAGGILIGYETLNGDIIIEYATQPCKKDKRTRISFDRVDKKHNKILKSIWKKHGNIHAYVGEWHTHPEKFPNYSLQDKRNWIQIGSEMNKEKFIHIIVGNDAIVVWEYSRNNEKILKIGEVINV